MTPRGPRRRQAGFTLIELMIALLISSLLVGMILAIFSRMSLAYRGQQQIAGVQQVLSAARAAIDLDAKQAGFGMAQGFTSQPTLGVIQSPVQVIDGGAGGPDELKLFYADPTAQALVTGIDNWPGQLMIDAGGFTDGDLIALTTAETSSITSPYGASEANITRYTTCIAKISSAAGSAGSGAPATLVLDTGAPWGWGPAGNGPCTAPPTVKTTMVYRFVAHAYRIDTATPARAALGPLQQSQTGDLLGTGEVWSEIAYGFTDLQTALRGYQKTAGTDPDGDGDANRDWYSSGNQASWNTAPVDNTTSLLQMSVSLVARTDRDVEGISTRSTPVLTDAAHPDNNMFGNRDTIALPSKPPWLADPALQGARIYRHISFQVDFRNLGVGR